MNMDEIFCANQIVIPPTLPSILKKYAKAAIRTQPYDLLVWSAAYFRAMSKSATPPVKARLEFPFPENRQLTLGYVKLLVYQFGRSGEISRSELTQKWNDVCLPPDTLYNILRLGSFAHTVVWDRFIAITTGFLEPSLKGTMLRLCEVMTEEPEGGSAMVPCQLFLSLYRYLGELDCGITKERKVSDVAPTEEKQPCRQDENETYSASGKDIDSVIREIREADSNVSVDTRLEGEGNELDWPNLFKSDSEVAELRFPSEPSDIGGTSRYGIEVMTEFNEQEGIDILEPTSKIQGEDEVTGEDKALSRPDKGKIQVLYEERRKPQVSERDSEISDDTELERDPETGDLKDSISLPELVTTTDKKTLDDAMDQAVHEAEDMITIEEDIESEVGSMRIILEEKEGEDSSSEKDSQCSENKKPLTDIDDQVVGIQKSVSLVDLRATMDRDLRKKTLNDAIIGEEMRKAQEKQAAAEAAEKQRIEDEALENFHMNIPGIGPRLPEDLMEKFEDYMKCCAERQAGMVMPRNIRHFLCPPIDLESLIRTKELTSLLDEVTQIPEYKLPSSMHSDFIKVIQSDSCFDIESSADSVLTPESVQSLIPVTDLSTVSEQAQTVGRATSLSFLLNQEKQH